jgi:hypothetical protein
VAASPNPIKATTNNIGGKGRRKKHTEDPEINTPKKFPFFPPH